MPAGFQKCRIINACLSLIESILQIDQGLAPDQGDIHRMNEKTGAVRRQV